jgi:hypothetical protein
MELLNDSDLGLMGAILRLLEKRWDKRDLGVTVVPT